MSDEQHERLIVHDNDDISADEKQGNLHLRWIVLMMNCILLIGNYYAYDLPSALAPRLRTHLGLDDDKERFAYLLGLFYSVYSLPNILLPFISGHLIERVGIKRVLVVLSVFVCSGQAMFAFGTATRQIWLMILGRMVFGVGGESISVVQSCISTQWFHNKELAFALGLNLAVPRVGSVMNAMFSPMIANSIPTQNNSPAGSWWSFNGVTLAVWVGFLMCCASFASSLVLAYGVGCEPHSDESVDDMEDSNDFKEPLTLSSLIRDTFKSTSTLPLSFWLLCPIVMLVYGTIIPFNNIIIEFLQTKWFSGNLELSGKMMSIPDLVCAILVSPCGYIVDRVGKRASIVIASCLSISAIHLTLAFVPGNTSGHETIISIFAAPMLPLILIGIAYSFYGVAYWSSIAAIFTVNLPKHCDSDAEIPPVTPSVHMLNISSLSRGSVLTRRKPGLSSTTLPLLAASRSFSVNSTLSLRAIQSQNQPPQYPAGLNIYFDDANMNTPLFRNASLPQSATAPNLHPRTSRRYQGSLSSSHFNSPLVQSHTLPRSNNIESDNDEVEFMAPAITQAEHEETMDLAGKMAVAYGVSTSLMNLALTGIPVIVAAIRHTHSFVGVEVFFAIEACAAAMFATVLWYLDWKWYRFGQLEASHYHVSNAHDADVS